MTYLTEILQYNLLQTRLIEQASLGYALHSITPLTNQRDGDNPTLIVIWQM